MKALRLEYGMSQEQKENLMSGAQWERARSACGRGWEGVRGVWVQGMEHVVLLKQEKNLDFMLNALSELSSLF